ncbi:MarR family winged helix-turn-helix transcriptional regulator [Polyangium jinanense]|uniref:Winged helix-turn-helix transcriptional regulator n=1 Tax=Polyangium jinanense TaxID=2829994 RepID=A0A9X4AWA0_9BACT|nr:MarR family winged helix-turn-helix transcriptional regulator [Polyangium jinanense]MDC3956971.1 winged helix-turn-helix transcriptional regulator [Polyangium jinanense]MDC3987128.1 winged helix-turn-helix transcriptional regulator [Polyangium jinanense]
MASSTRGQSSDASLAPSEILCNCLAIRQAARQITQLYDEELAGTGLRATQYAVLSRLSRIAPATMQDLAEALVMDRTTLTHNLKPLEREGLVVMGVAEHDRRVRQLRLTPAGTATLKEARVAWARAQARFEDAYGADDAAELRRQLARAVEAART